MRAWRLERHGGPEVLVERELPTPEPGEGEVRVALDRVGLNYAEVLSRKGLYGWAPKRPYTLGMEGAGRIEGVGRGVDRARIGEEVVVGVQHGAYAERIVLPAEQALVAPAHLTPVERAAFPVNWMTAWVGLVELGRIRAGDRVWISPAAGGVGTAAVQMAAAMGAEVLGLAGGAQKCARVRKLGAAHAIDYRRPGWESEVARALPGSPDRPGGVEIALEMVGGEVFKACKRALAPFGRAVVVGYAELDYSLWKPWSWPRALSGIPRMPLKEMFLGSKGLLSSHLGYLLDDPGILTRTWRELCAFVEAHGLRPVVGHVMPMSEVAEAHRLMESRGTTGKVVLEW